MPRLALPAALLLAAASALAEPLTLPARGEVRAAFSPGDDAAALVVATLGEARRQVLVHAYSLTHRAIADALVAAHRRGVDVQVLADLAQSRTLATSRLGDLAARGIPVWLDGEHAAAHNKVMILDADQDEAAVITGSFNFTQAAQYRNAENLLVLRGHPALAQAYASDWRRHRSHALRLRR